MKGLATIEGGAVVYDENLIARAVADWVNFCDVGELTQRAYNSAVAKFFAFIRSNGLMLNADTLKKFREYCKENFQSVATARLYFTISRKFCQWTCQKMNVGDFTLGVKNIKVENDVHSRDALPLEDVAKVINAIDGDKFVAVRNRTILTLAAELGLRRVELQRLNLDSIELRRNKYFLRVHGKARAGANDFVPLPKAAMKILQEYLKLRAEVMKNGEVDKKAPMFISTSNNSYGRRLGLSSFSKLTKAALKRAGFNSARVVLHSFRHSFASAGITEGVNKGKATIRNIQKTLRHKNPLTTEIYLHDEEELFNNPVTEIVAAKLEYYLERK